MAFYRQTWSNPTNQECVTPSTPKSVQQQMDWKDLAAAALTMGIAVAVISFEPQRAHEMLVRLGHLSRNRFGTGQ